jgi:two-component system LytT family sensor kinase
MQAPDPCLRRSAHLPRTVLTLLLILAVATLFFTGVAYVSALSGPGPSPASYMFFWHAAKFCIWAAVSPAIIALSRRYPIDRTAWIRPVALHFFAALLFSFVVTTLFITCLWILPSLHRGLFSSPADAIQNGSVAFSWGVLIYWAVLLATTALDNYRRFRSEQLRGVHLQALLAEAQLLSLRMQLQPHFLFNTLHSLSDLVLEDSQAAVRMITKLGDFLRLTIEGPGDQIIPLRQELEFARSYLEIEQVRFHDRLKILITAEPETYAAQVPNFVLQPIVENAVRHGISMRIGAGRITINAKRSATQLQITVEDDGPGPPSRRQAQNEGVGLANVRTRLRQLYGVEQSLELTGLKQGKDGTIVSLNIPFIVSKLPETNGEQM